MYKQPDQGFKIEKNGGTKNKIEKNKSDARVAGTFIKYKKMPHRTLHLTSMELQKFYEGTCLLEIRGTAYLHQYHQMEDRALS